MEKKSKVITIVLTAAITILVITGIALLTIQEKNRTKDHKTAKAWAIEETLEDFYEIRNKETDIYTYKITEIIWSELEIPETADFFKFYGITLTDENANSEYYYVKIAFKLDQGFWQKFNRTFTAGAGKLDINNQHFSKDNIVYIKYTELTREEAWW